MADIRLNVQFGKKILNGFEIGISLPYYNLASIEAIEKVNFSTVRKYPKFLSSYRNNCWFFSVDCRRQTAWIYSGNSFSVVINHDITEDHSLYLFYRHFCSIHSVPEEIKAGGGQRKLRSWTHAAGSWTNGRKKVLFYCKTRNAERQSAAWKPRKSWRPYKSRQKGSAACKYYLAGLYSDCTEPEMTYRHYPDSVPGIKALYLSDVYLNLEVNNVFPGEFLCE